MTEPGDRIAPLVEAGDYRQLLAVALRARAAQDDGRYCECDLPIVTGRDLLCARCLLNNREQEVKACDWFCKAHGFEPNHRPRLRDMFCDRCTMPAADPRHHGVDAQPRYSWEARP